MEKQKCQFPCNFSKDNQKTDKKKTKLTHGTFATTQINTIHSIWTFESNEIKVIVNNSKKKKEKKKWNRLKSEMKSLKRRRIIIGYVQKKFKFHVRLFLRKKISFAYMTFNLSWKRTI